MDADTWRQEAEAFARATSEALDTLERDIEAVSSGGSYKALWERTRTLGESIRTAPAILSPDKIELQQRLSALVRTLREQQRAFHRETEATRQDIASRLQLVAEAAAEATTAADIAEARADLVLLRERITGLGPHFPRSVRTQLWERWQEINRSTWSALVQQREANEAALGGILDEAQEQLDKRQTRAARETIKRFHTTIAELDVSHPAAKRLRGRANALWQSAAEQGREQREHFLAGARQRLIRFQNTLRHNERTRGQLVNQVTALERQVSSASTDVGHALARGQLAEVQRSLEKLQSENTRLAKQIQEIETMLGQEATPAG